ncbi:LOW QUALITY PROTEIN: rab9 effector protein with kelch motifs-like [Lethenteron reissneri]|nr:rab9 effector protein with kelch motifs-like isoform X2 [Lethenteron reissneri]XP_061434807.1 rab9 effector protein with kelch motifs-like isoform X2 [Lethenteron reissneri]XP_061434820.1 LOW QUALITY PROTEIN: rab9 effector protein with kelch motifs-like [Lethenteron reissneri]
MDLHAILEPGDIPKPGLWYVLAPRGQPPPVTVGHTCTHLAGSRRGAMGRVLIVGGANPEASFKHTVVLDLDTYEWRTPDWRGLQPRYEHAAFISPSAPLAESSPADENSSTPEGGGGRASGAEVALDGSPRGSTESPPPPPPSLASNSSAGLWVFGGADRTGNRNCVQRLDLEQRRWESPPVGGTPPCPRTYHSGAAAVGGTLYVVGGGAHGASAVRDARLYAFDSVNRRWSCPETTGAAPSPRHGHAVACVGARLYVHAGMDGADFLSDLHVLDTAALRWEKVRCRGDVPSGRAAHAALAHGRFLFTFGGLGPAGALSCAYKFHVDKQRWTLVKLNCPPPAPRLDHAMCIIPWVTRLRPDSPELPSQDAAAAVAGASSPPHPPPRDAAGQSESAPRRSPDETERAASPSSAPSGATGVAPLHGPDVVTAGAGRGPASVIGDPGGTAGGSASLCLVFGGMDGEGEIFNDCMAMLLE